jgi:hypothetical protein
MEVELVGLFLKKKKILTNYWLENEQEYEKESNYQPK